MGPARLQLQLLLLVAAAAAGVLVRAADEIREAQCALRCAGHHDRAVCTNECMRERVMSKPGQCPDPTTLTPFEAACILSCADDGDCPATDKCCQHDCGATCQHAAGLDTAPGLSAVPTNVTASERGSHKRVRLQWLLPGDADERHESLIFVLEERHHVGRRLRWDHMGHWRFLYKSKRSNCLLPRNLIKPGRWYQFRVAAVNSNGTRGFSWPSHPFKLSTAPRPPTRVQNMTLGQLEPGPNNTVECELSWDPPAESDLPVDKYQVFWSHELEPARSLMIHQVFVFGDQTHFRLDHLDQNIVYFVQVQAVSFYGHKRLESEKASMFLNTTLPVAMGT